jgi:hypothetical protein
MCQICALGARYSRAHQDSLVFNLSQFVTVVEAKALVETKPLPEQSETRSPTNQEKSS